MPKEVSEDAIAKFLIQNGVVAPEKVEAARAEQADAARRGLRMSLLEALGKLGLIPAAEREKIEKQLNSPTTVRVRKLGNFKLLDKLGEGGMGAVYVAEDTVNPRKVAVKVLSRQRARDQEFLTRFKREAQASVKLHHENLVAGLSTGVAFGRFYYAMEFCDGEPLDKLLARETCLPWEKALGIVVQIARGLEYAHEQGFIHRDIKPSNIFLTRAGVAKILDMGLLKHVVGKQSFSTKPGIVIGSPHYLSPEQIHAKKNIDCRADIYSLGATFYHLLTGHTPFTGPTPVLVLMKHLDAPVPNPKTLRAEIPESIAGIVQRMMAKDPAGRYGNCTALLADLQAAPPVPSLSERLRVATGKWSPAALAKKWFPGSGEAPPDGGAAKK